MKHSHESGLQAMSTVLSSQVCGTDGHTLGHTRDVFLDLKTSSLRYLVMEARGTGGAVTSLLVPWAALTWNEHRGCLTLDITPDRLAQAPKFDPTSETDWGEADWRQKVERYYGLGPDWEKPANYTG